MPTQCHPMTRPPVEILFTWSMSKEIAIREISRPFVQDATKVRNVLDAPFQGYPLSFLIAWKNPGVRPKDGMSSTRQPSLSGSNA